MKFFKNKNYLVLLASGALALGGCTDSLEAINENPNAPEKVPTYSLLYAAEKGMMTNMRDEWMGGQTTQLFAQHFAQRGYTSESRYSLRPSTSSNYFRYLYGNLTDLQKIIKIAEDDALKGSYSADSGLPENQVQVARILKSYVFQFMTDLWGPVPYNSYGDKENENFQALKAEVEDGGITSPKYASEEAIYKDLLKELKDAAEKIDVSEKSFNQYDRIYSGNSEKWKKLANSLRLRIAMRMMDKDAALAKQHIDEAIAGGVFTSNEDNAKYTYEKLSSKASHWFKDFTESGRNDYTVSIPFEEILKGKKGPFKDLVDPRIKKFLEPTASGEYKGMPYGIPQGMAPTPSAAASDLSKEIRENPEFPEYLMEYAEVEFLLSKYKNNDDTHYKNGIRASMEKWGVPADEIATYLVGVPAANDENLAVQRYIAAFMQPEEAWSVYRESGYPNTLIEAGDVIYTTSSGEEIKFQPLDDQVTKIPSRLQYPDKEQNYNSINYFDAVKMIGGKDDLASKVWWNK